MFIAPNIGFRIRENIIPTVTSDIVVGRKSNERIVPLIYTCAEVKNIANRKPIETGTSKVNNVQIVVFLRDNKKLGSTISV
jgi:hypothetical protein